MIDKKPMRTEQEVFADLAAICCRPGYAHAIAHICFRDNVILHAGDMKEADMRKMFSPSRLIRTEINTLLGLMTKADIDWILPAPRTLQEYMDATETRADGKMHDLTFGFKEGSGITFHCTDEPSNVAGPRLKSYCSLRKYREKASQWFGLCMTFSGPDVRFGASLVFPWSQDEQMDEKSKELKEALPIDQALQTLMMKRSRARKISRNDPCPCGSGRKYKKCCL